MAIPDCITDIPLLRTKTRYTKSTRLALHQRGYAACSQCGDIKVLHDFRADHRASNGVRNACKECERLEGSRRRLLGKDARRKQKINQNKQQRKHQKSTTAKQAPAIAGVYVLQMGDIYKIGRSSNIQRRMSELCGMLPYPTVLICTIPDSRKLKSVELELHRRYSSKRLNGEWFTLEPEDVVYVRSLAK